MSKSKKLIIQIIPDGPGMIKDYMVPRWALKAAFWVGFFLFIGLGVMVFNVSLIVEKLVMNQNLKAANERLWKENQHLKTIRNDLDDILLVESKLKNITQVMLNGQVEKEIKVYEEKQPILVTQNELDKFVAKVEKEGDNVTADENDIPSVKPVIGIISQQYKIKHQGTDIAALLNDPVFTTAPGVVVFAGVLKDFGKVIKIKHGDGFTTVYAHLNRIVVNKGDFVKRGQNIGMVGMTGNTTGPHLHYEVIKDGLKVNPEDYFIN
ncbi:MAG: M23 family metallopeptidase [Fibrobacterales bacterium]